MVLRCITVYKFNLQKRQERFDFFKDYAIMVRICFHKITDAELGRTSLCFKNMPPVCLGGR